MSIISDSADNLMLAVTAKGMTLVQDIADVKITINEDGTEVWEAIPYEDN